MNIDVLCYAGYRGEENPRSFMIGGHEIIVQKIISRWKTPDKRVFKVIGDDNKTYILCHDEERWMLTHSE